MDLTNCTRPAYFLLVGLSTFGRMESMMFTSVFLLYLLTLMGNGIIIMMVIMDCHLQKPMYFFLNNLSFIDIGYSTSFIPRLLLNYLSASNSICFYCCVIQLCFCFLFGVTEFFIITLISLDRYVAICHPLRYATIMILEVCLKLAIGAWFGSFISIICQVMMIANLPYCVSNVINHLFCEVGPVLKIARGDTRIIETLGFLVFVLVIMSPLLFTLVSYLFIIFTILQMPTTSRQQRVFSTCASHLIVVFILYGSIFFVYLRPTVKNSSFRVMKVASIMYTMITPVLNPFIYTIRNNEVKEAEEENDRKILSSVLEGMGIDSNFKEIF